MKSLTAEYTNAISNYQYYLKLLFISKIKVKTPNNKSFKLKSVKLKFLINNSFTIGKNKTLTTQNQTTKNQKQM